MNRYSHVAIGLAAGIGVAGLSANADIAWPSAAVAAVAALVPDLDTRFGLPPRARYQPACRPMLRAMEHRGALHAPSVGILLGIVVGALTGSAWVALAIQAGYLSHALSDSPSPMGVPLFWPFSNKRYRLGPIKITSGNCLVEWPLAAVILLVTMWASGLALPR